MSLDINDLAVSLDGKEILHSISLQIQNGELFSLLGPSGCGKTTLLKTIAGLNIQDSGTIFLDGRSLDGLPPEKRDVAVVFQELRLFPNMNVVQNVAFPLKMRGVDKKKRLELASEMLGRVQLEGFDKRRITQLSGGQQQRVALARAIVANPKVLLLDEPFSALDENLRDDMRDLLTHLHENMDITMVLVTHDQTEALKLSDRLAIMDSGNILQCDTPRETYNNPANLEIAKYFSDSNIIEGNCTGGRFECKLFSAECDLKDGPAVAMVREIAIKLVEQGSGQAYRIVRADYLGDKQKIVAVRDGISLELEVETLEVFEVGEEVRLDIDTDKVLFFDAGE
ncbi:MAG: ABC transporter ATP-binding protein [Coriobacteriales bacterium]|jgi:putative spermidine/putrescine transport system ATP-binding protein